MVVGPPPRDGPARERRTALLIAVIALFLALSETLGKGAQTEAISKNVEASNLWAFFQAKSIRRTVVQATAEHAKLSLGTVGDDASKAALQPQPVEREANETIPRRLEQRFMSAELLIATERAAAWPLPSSCPRSVSARCPGAP